MATKYIGIEKYMFADSYNLFLKYQDMDDIDSNWEMVVADAGDLTAKYKNHKLIMSLTLAVLEQLEHKVCDRESKGYNHYQWETILKDQHTMKQF